VRAVLILAGLFMIVGGAGELITGARDPGVAWHILIVIAGVITLVQGLARGRS
jgi:hypothetical protein